MNIWTKDRGRSQVPARLQVERVVRVQNEALWRAYSRRMAEVGANAWSAVSSD